MHGNQKVKNQLLYHPLKQNIYLFQKLQGTLSLSSKSWILKEDIKHPIIIKVDNIGAIYIAKNNTSNNQMKHINTRYYFVRNYIEDRTIRIDFVRSENNDSDIFTKTYRRNYLLNTAINLWIVRRKKVTRDGQRETDNARRTTRDGHFDRKMRNQEFKKDGISE